MRSVSFRPAVPGTAVLVIFACTLIAAAPRVAEPRVADGGMLFSEEAASEANDIIRLIRQSYDRDVMVETFPAVPEELKGELARDGKEKFYADWLERRAAQLGVRGVFILVTREPGRVQVGVDRATRRRVFTVEDREALREALVTAFRARQFDQGLLDGLRLVRRRMDQNTAAERNPTVPVSAPATVAVASAAPAAACRP
jgi:uncharacterized membrane protein YgcG